MNRDLHALWDPRSIAVVGASTDPTKWGGDMAARLARNEKRRPLYFVNRKSGTVCGRRAYPSLSDLPEAPEMAYLAVPAGAFEATVDEALALGVKVLVVILAGLGEAGAEGRERERLAVERVRAAGALMVGPNCMGVADTTTAFQGVAYLDIPAGHIGWVSMSGAMGEEFAMRARAARVGFSRYINLGNQADVSISEVLCGFREHDATHVVAVYAEDMKDGRGLAAAVAGLEEAGKPVVLMAPGRSAASARAARSHTGSLAPDAAVLDAVARATGMARADDPGELFETTVGLLHVVGLARECAATKRGDGTEATIVSPPAAAEATSEGPLATAGAAGVAGRVRLPAGPRVGIVTEGGGHGGMAAEALDRVGLEVPALSVETVAAVRAGHPASVGRNPIDFAIGTTDPDAYALTVPAIARSGEVDAVFAVGQLGYWNARLCEHGAEADMEIECARRVAVAARAAGIPLFVATVYSDGEAAAALRQEGVPVFREIAAAAKVLGRLAAHASTEPTGVPGLPPPEAPLAAYAAEGREAAGVADEAAVGAVMGAAAEGMAASDGAAAVAGAVDYGAAREVLAQAGIEFSPARSASAATSEDLVDAAVEAARQIGYPVAVKAHGVLHKSDAGGVALDLSDEAAVRAAVTAMAARLPLTDVSVERMAPVADGVEVIIGCRQDRRFGPVLLVGLGGIYAELLCDVRTALAPVTEKQAEALLRELRGASLLTGARGRAPLDLPAAARAAARLSRFAAAHPEIAEIEINPLLVLPEGALALDARIIVHDTAGDTASDAAGDTARNAVDDSRKTSRDTARNAAGHTAGDTARPA